MNIKRQTIVLGLICSMLFAWDQAQAFYNPSAGRWLSRDPLGESESKNLLECVRNDPINFVDTDGRQLSPGLCVVCGQPAFAGHKCVPPPTTEKPCGKLVIRATYPSEKVYRCIDNCATRLFAPHMFVILADGSRLTLGGDTQDENHWSASTQTILIPKDTDCAAFSKCVKDYYAQRSRAGYKSFGNNCHVALDAIKQCGGRR
jgi:hypothetical protein